ncbi:MAG: LON peptidase substrate-binding domain-containing protein [Actinomycetota bacterium]
MGEIGLFTLNVVLLPGERVPLHIFEDRYKELIGECLEKSEEFGLLLAEETELRTVGTSARVVEVLNRYDDGRMDVVVEGRERFRVTRVTESTTYLTAEIQPFADDEAVGDPELVAGCMSALERVATAAGTDASAVEISGDEVAWDVASQVDFGAEFKQELLEMRTENERLRRLAEALDGAAAAITRQREIRERASGNGKVDSL